MRSLFAIIMVGLPVCALGAVPGQDPDWPCQQRLVPEVTAGTFWPDTLPEASASTDPRVTKLVAETAPREVPLDEASAKLAAFLKALKPAERKTLPAAAFVAIVAATNDQRTQVIGGLKDINQRQHDIAALVSKVNGDLAAIPADATGDAAASRLEMVQRKEFLARSFEDLRKTIRYACEVPGQLDQRLGAFAKLLQGAAVH